MSAAIIGVVLLLLAALGVGIYFMVSAKKCKDYETQDECKEPCQWDTYGYKCVGEDDDLTPAPPTSPASRTSPTSAHEPPRAPRAPRPRRCHLVQFLSRCRQKLLN
jgi:hypothetical protein